MQGFLSIPSRAPSRVFRRAVGLLANAIATGVLFVSTAGADAPAELPLEDGWYVARNACPFECCTYRTWRAVHDTRLYTTQRSAEPAGRVTAGQRVVAVTGVVYAQPVPVDVIHDHSDSNGGRLRQGERFYLLDYLGEGIHHIWLNGEVRDLDALGLYRIDPETQLSDVSRFESCDAPSVACWWRIAPDFRHQRTEWWVKLRTDDGTEGWTDQPEHFVGKDACG